MAQDGEAATILEQARELIRAGMAGDLAAHCQLETPLRVRDPAGRLHSWMVPLARQGRLCAFLQLTPAGTLVRHSCFQRHPDSLAGCPSADAWLDPLAVRRRAASGQPPGAVAGEPVLSFDRVPSRLAWAVPFTTPDGARRTVFVAGDIAWVAGESEDSIGGPPGV